MRNRKVKTIAEMQRHKGGTAYRSSVYSFLLISYVLLPAIFAVAGCGGGGQSIDALLADARSQLATAQEAGAEQFAEPDYAGAVALLAEAEIALRNKDKSAPYLLEKLDAKARLAEALARQSIAEAELARLETELEEASAEANRILTEYQSAEEELARLSADSEE